VDGAEAQRRRGDEGRGDDPRDDDRADAPGAHRQRGPSAGNSSGWNQRRNVRSQLSAQRGENSVTERSSNGMTKTRSVRPAAMRSQPWRALTSAGDADVVFSTMTSGSAP